MTYGKNYELVKVAKSELLQKKKRNPESLVKFIWLRTVIQLQK